MKKLFISVGVVGTLAFGFSACTDDHFDVNSDVLGQKTIWENIASNPNLSEYADILKSVKYSSSESKATDETYAELLNSDQTFTVWAPENGSFNYSYYKQLLSSGNRENIYRVEKELIRNNMTRFANIVNGLDSMKLELYNGKAAWLNYDNGTIKGLKMTSPNVGASNGVLHVTNGAIAYQANMYEYLSSCPGLDSLNAFIKHFEDKDAFDENASIKGPTVDGKVTWVDSITYVNNDYLDDYLSAFLTREDSNYVMLLPTNEAWTTKLASAKKYFKYKDSYVQDVHMQNQFGEDSLVSGVETAFSQFEKDSLNNFYAKTFMVQNLVYNANWQYGNNITSLRGIAAADSLHTTTGTKLKKPGTLNETNKHDCIEANFTDIFGTKSPVELSNGYAYVRDEFPYSFNEFAPVRYLSPSGVLEYYDKSVASNKTYTMTFYKNNELDTVINVNNLVLDAKTSTSQPVAYFKLRNVLSCKYDMYVVMTYNLENMQPNRFQVKIDYDNETGKRVKGEYLKNPNEGAIDVSGAELFGTNYYVNREPNLNAEAGPVSITDTIMIAKDFEFPVCYYGTELSNAYPVLTIQSNFLSKENKLYSRNLWINSIILKPKEW